MLYGPDLFWAVLFHDFGAPVLIALFAATLTLFTASRFLVYGR